MQPQLPEANQLLAQIWDLIRQNNVHGAVAACQAMNQNYPDHANGWYASSFLALGLGGQEHALNSIESALRIEPSNPRFLLHKSACLQALFRFEPALDILRGLLKSESGDDALWGEIGLLASKLNEHDMALKAFDKAISHNPQDGRLHFNRATILRFNGDLEGAEAACNRAIELNPQDYDARFLRSGLKKQNVEENNIDELESTLAGIAGDPVGEALVGYALAKEYEDIGNYRESFKALQRGATARRSSFDYQVEEDLQFIDTIINTYSQEFISKPHVGHDSKEPIFVLGLPRTGTTLVERILGNHSQVTSAGELTQFTRCIAGFAHSLSQQNPGLPASSRSDMVRITAQINFDELGKTYLESTRPMTGQSERFIDKFPPNTLNIGPIRLALPKAKIVLLKRHPMDSCYSMYKQLFTDIYQFSYDLQELGRYFVAHQRLLDHWLNIAGEHIHVVKYEDLVAEPDQEARKLLSFCELPWEDQVLEFHLNPQASTTASASQVRQKIYSSSVGKWKDYEEELEPLRKIIEAAGYLQP